MRAAIVQGPIQLGRRLVCNCGGHHRSGAAVTGACAKAAYARLDALVQQEVRYIKAIEEDHAGIAIDRKVWRLEALIEARDLFGPPQSQAERPRRRVR